MLPDNFVDGLIHRVFDHCAVKRQRLAALGSEDRRLADSSATRTGQFLALRVAHVPAVAAHIGLVDFHRTGELHALDRAIPAFADAVQHELGIRLADADVAVKLHAGDALEACDLKIDGDGLLGQRHP